MQRTEFEASLRDQGFEVIEKTVEPNFTAKLHTHPWEVRILVVEGQMSVTKEGQVTVCNAGDTFAMDAGCEHFESYGPSGSTYVLGRREAKAA